MCKKDDRSPHQKSRLFIASKGVHLALRGWTHIKSLKMFITEYMLVVRYILL